MAVIDFLTFPITSIRKSIKDIDDSYRNPWDIYAELTQNSVDAIHKMQQDVDEIGKITIKVNAKEKSIYFADNGCGISNEDLPRLLQLFSTGKESDTSSVGEKGVGLKFVYFQSNYFEIISNDGHSGGKAVIKDARLWKNGTSEELLKLDYEDANDAPRGTSITLRGIDISGDDEQAVSIFKLSFDQLMFVLRNKTFLGDTSYLWDSDKPKIEITLTYTDYNGEEKTGTVKNEYILPVENLSSNDVVDLDEFDEWIKAADRSDSDKRKKLQGKVLVTKGTYLHNDYRKISYWACFMPTRRDWDNINKAARLLPSDGADELWSENHAYCMYSPGIYTATKGMPTGISIDAPPNTGSAGYWSNIFMMFQDDSLSFDIGRKSIHGKIQAIYQAKAKEIFKRIRNYVTKYTSAIPISNISDNNFDRYNVIQEINKLVNLNSNNVSFIKVPTEQEASVSAIFFELVGSNKISDIEPIYLGYRNRYDLYANYISHIDNKRHFCFIEFKSHLRHITTDFSEARKVFDEMDYIICWDVNDVDIQELNNFGINCEVVNQGTLHAIDCPHSVTHMLTIPNCNPVYVIDLKRMM